MSIMSKISIPSVKGGTSFRGKYGHGQWSLSGRVDGVQAAEMQIGKGWHPGDDAGDGSKSFYFFHRDEKEKDEPSSLFTPLMARRAAGFSASEIVAESAIVPVSFIAEAMKAFSIYEINLRTFSGMLPSLGIVINRYG